MPSASSPRIDAQRRRRRRRGLRRGCGLRRGRGRGLGRGLGRGCGRRRGLRRRCGFVLRERVHRDADCEGGGVEEFGAARLLGRESARAVGEALLVDELEAGPVPPVLAPDLDDDRLLRPREEGVVAQARGDGVPQRHLVGARRRLRCARVDEARGTSGVCLPGREERGHPHEGRAERRCRGESHRTRTRRYATAERPGHEIRRHAACHRRRGPSFEVRHPRAGGPENGGGVRTPCTSDGGLASAS